jgi:hypothetical protein
MVTCRVKCPDEYVRAKMGYNLYEIRNEFMRLMVIQKGDGLEWDGWIRTASKLDPVALLRAI